MKKIISKKVAIFDIDGTIFRSSLLVEMVESLVQARIFPESAKKSYAQAYKKWSNRQGSYEGYINAVVKSFEKNIKGVPRKNFMQVLKSVSAFHKNRVYRFTRDLIKDLKKKNYYLLAISGSPADVVAEFCRGWGFDKAYGTYYEVDKNNKFTGQVLHRQLAENKAKMIERAIDKEGLKLDNGSIAVGDTEMDIPMFQLVDRPICFNPNKKLYQTAKKFGWEVVVERKNMIYKF